MFSSNLKKFRDEKKLTKAELSRMTGLSARTIEYLENEKMDNPTLKTLEILSEALGVSVEELIK